MTHTPTVAVDFDGVIHRYSKGWHDGTIYDEPMPGAIPALTSLLDKYCVFIHTSRDADTVAEWLDAQCDVPVIVDDGSYGPFWDQRWTLLVTNRKLGAIAYIDDRAIPFISWSQTLIRLAKATAHNHTAELSCGSVRAANDQAQGLCRIYSSDAPELERWKWADVINSLNGRAGDCLCGCGEDQPL